MVFPDGHSRCGPLPCGRHQNMEACRTVHGGGLHEEVRSLASVRQTLPVAPMNFFKKCHANTSAIQTYTKRVAVHGFPRDVALSHVEDHQG